MYGWITKGSTTELVKYKLDFVYLAELKLKEIGSEWAEDFTFFL
jgi:hypothetical protein